MRARKVCCVVTCGLVAQPGGRRCEKHAAELERERGSRHQRGYGSAHDAVRARLLREWSAALRRGAVVACWRCLEPMLPGQELAADHSGLGAAEGGVADRLAHASCNSGKRLPPGTTEAPPAR